MDWLLFGFIADMYGPYFLVLYGSVIAVTLAVCWWMVRRSDRTGDSPPLSLPAQPDPYEIAFLRGGENELARVVIFGLIQRGYLEVVEKKVWVFSLGQKLAQKANHPDPRHLSALERDVFGWFSDPRAARDVFRSSPARDRIKDSCEVSE